MHRRSTRIRFAISFLCLSLFISACQLIRPEPTATVTQTATATRVPLTSTPTITPTATETPLPHYLSVDPESVRGIAVSVWHGQRDQVKKELEFLTAKFNDENAYGIQVVLEGALSDFQLNDEIIGNGPSGELPNMVIADSHWLRYWQSEKIPLMNLQEYQDHPVYGFNAQGISPVMDVMLAQEKFNRALIGLPLWHNPELLFYNRTWAQALGFSNPPVTMNDFSEQICAAFNALNQDEDIENNGTGGWILSATTGTLMSWMINLAESLPDLDNFPQDSAEESFLAVSSLLRELFDQGCVWQSRVPEPYDYFARRYALLYSGTFSGIQLQRRAFANNEMTADDEWDVLAYPRRLENGKLRDPQIFSTAVSAGIFTASAEEQFASWLFLSWLMQDENLTELALAADGWPVQDSPVVDNLYQEKANSKIYGSLNLRKYIYPVQLSVDWHISGLVLSDGFEHVFNASTPYDKISDIWVQITDTLSEVIDRE